MISNKKSYAMKMLQLALALSLLQADPDNFLYQRLDSWDSQLELRDGDGWELEMLRAVPIVEYPYANRKTMMPLIDDLVCFDRQHSNNQYNVTAYLLNVQSEGVDQTAAVQELQTTVATPSSTAIAPGAMALEQATSAAAGIVNVNTSSLGLGSPDIDHFLHSEHFQDQISMWEQNLADLNDFGELPPSLNTYAGLPMKDEPSDVSYLDFHVDAYFPGFGPVHDGAVALNDSTPNPSDTSTIKVEQFDKDEGNEMKVKEDLDAVASCSTLSVGGYLKKEEPEDGDERANPHEVELSPFISDVELTQEESEIVEVLWKQDVDLGYTLSPPNLGNGTLDAASGSDALKHSINASDDVVEKLKALEELKHDKLKFDAKDDDDDVLNDDDLSNEWAGIPFTIDNETGEYIRLPLEDLLNDVLQLADFVDDEETIDDSIASTSKAAACKINNNNSISNTNSTLIDSKSEEGKADDDNNNKNGVNKEDKLKDNYIKANTNSNRNNEEDKISNDDDLPQSEIEVSSLPSPLFDLNDEANEELADLDIMIQSAAPPFHHHHHAHHAHAHRPSVGVQNYAVGGGANSAFHRQATGFHHSHHQSRVPLSRGVSMEQRLQDIASLFNPIPSMGVSDMSPYAHYSSHHYAYQSAAGPPQHAQYPPPPPHPHHHGHHAMLHANATLGVDICPTSQPHYGHNLGSAVTSSMHLTNASGHDGDVGAGATGGVSNVGAYKMEHDMMYYSNASSDMNHTTDGFINSILNDEDLHLMDMNVNESFCRMVDVNNSTSNNSSVLGISSGGHASGNTGSSTNGLSMSAGNGGGGGGGGGTAGGMTSDLMNSGASGGDRLDASSDSAVSSMGSERVPSLSDGEWGEGSDSAQDYHHGKYGGPYDYSYSNNNRLNDGTRQPPVAQKKHQMFGKRYLQEQPGLGSAASTNNGNGAIVDNVAGATNNGGELLQAPPPIKYEYEPYPTVIGGLPHTTSNLPMSAESAMGPILSKEMQAYDLKYGASGIGGGYSLDFSLRPPRTPHDIVHHNHTYTLPQGSGSLPRPQQRDKKMSTSSSKSSKSSSNGDEEHLTRDEKRARALSIPIQVHDIINLPMDEFNERLSKYDLTENQLSLIRDIRRRGKNKVAAQNCRKRKLDQILTLEDEVKEVRRRKDQLCHDRDALAVERKRISNKFAALHRHIFQYLRDPEGNPCSPSEYSLQQAADGSIYLLPRDNNKTDANNATAIATSRGLNCGIGGTSSNSNGVIGSNSNSNNNMHTNLAQQLHPHIIHGNTQQQQQQQHGTHAHNNHHQSQQQQTNAHHTVAAHTTQQHPHHPHQKD